VQGKFIASILARGQIYAPIYMPAIMQADYCNMGEIGKEFSIKIESVFPFPFFISILETKAGNQNRISQQKPLYISKIF
jgi:hypothetical protein